MKIGLIGFGRTGKAVAAAILENKEFSLEWVYRRKTLLENRSIAEFLGIESDENGRIFSSEHITIDELLDTCFLPQMSQVASTGEAACAPYGHSNRIIIKK